MDIEIHNIQTIEQLKEKFEILGNSARSDFSRMGSFVEEKMSSIRNSYNTLKNRVREAERRLDNANIALHIARNSYDIDKDGNRVPKSTHSEERAVARCQAGLNSAIKNLQMFEESYSRINGMINTYQTEFNRVQYNFCDFPIHLSQCFTSVIQYFKNYIELSNEKIQ